MSAVRDVKSTLLEFESKESATFSADAMALMIARKKMHRNAKGFSFNCFVLDRNHETNKDELENFLKYLEQQKTKLPDNTRFQILYATRYGEGVHWSVADIRIKHTIIEFYLLDAACAFETVLPAIITINEICPTAIVRYSGIAAQRDVVNCATFAIDHVFRLSMIPFLHDCLSSIEHQGPLGSYTSATDYLDKLSTETTFAHLDRAKCKMVIPGIKYVSQLKFPAHFGPLLRNMQSIKTLEENFSPLMMGNNNKSLMEYVNLRTEGYGHGKKNMAIIYKREKLKEKTADFIRFMSKEALSSIIKNRTNYSFDFAKQNEAKASELSSSKIKVDNVVAIHLPSSSHISSNPSSVFHSKKAPINKLQNTENRWNKICCFKPSNVLE